MTGESIPHEQPCADTAVLRFRMDALHAKVEQIRLKASEVSEAAMRAVKAAMHSVGLHDPDRGPTDYDSFADERRFYQRLIRERTSSGHGSVNGNGSSRVLTILVALNTALLIGIGGWLLVTVSQHDKDIAVIKCQLDQQCREALARARP
jgi:hypothetical protein